MTHQQQSTMMVCQRARTIYQTRQKKQPEYSRLRAKRDKRVQRRYRAVAEVKVRDCKRSTAVITETKAGNNDVLFPEPTVGTDRRPSALFRTAVQEHTG